MKGILINKYHISASRIKAEGQGVGNMFSENDWNRVSICTIEDAEFTSRINPEGNESHRDVARCPLSFSPT